MDAKPITATLHDLQQGVRVLIPKRKTSNSAKGLWEITEALRRSEYSAPYLTLDVVNQLTAYPGEVQVNFKEYQPLSRFRPEDFDLYREQWESGLPLSMHKPLEYLYSLGKHDKVLDQLVASLRSHLSPAALPSGSLVGGAGEWVIVSFKEGRGFPYWRPNSAGYTNSIVDAGRYTFEQASAIVSGNHGDDEKYCLDDPALWELIYEQDFVRASELRLYLQTRAALPAPATGEAAGAGLIAVERQRQVEKEGWSAKHDDEHVDGELWQAAEYYRATADRRWELTWPWDMRFLKLTPNDRARELVKAGALYQAEADRLERREGRKIQYHLTLSRVNECAAEIDRLQRIAPPTPAGQGKEVGEK